MFVPTILLITVLNQFYTQRKALEVPEEWSAVVEAIVDRANISYRDSIELELELENRTVLDR